LGFLRENPAASTLSDGMANGSPSAAIDQIRESHDRRHDDLSDTARQLRRSRTHGAAR